MDLTQGSFNEKDARAKKMMLWFGIISLLMMFAGLTSAYVVSKNRPDWLQDFELPGAFLWSTITILLSSVTIHLAKKAIKKGKNRDGMLLLLSTLVLGILFIVFQFKGYGQIIENGYYFTGSQSTVTTSFLYAITIAHIAHVVAGIIVLVVIIYNHFKEKYNEGKTLGLELGATFWHFLDFLWVYLILFFYFFR
ncbi:heme-copper oxidase subunit III [Leptobacterium flavescens]|uniref:Heme-copper oxidase subunit III n=1 Tax=Leptobacterium flavescens TaxID=472055 RepID=A0A6P0UJT3_9FLAO|nr:cytochrome c oxidase subunit 3 [Leptobacterium flavescens]NER12660.1 heme-copper oxidase subunit III [Leptobacterium flavescens]